MERKISVIIPVYNCKNFLERAVESVINQKDFEENELILVDDGSTDGSELICDSYAADYKNIITIHQPNSGVSAARNTGLINAVGKWIFFLDSDDYILDNSFDNMLKQGEADAIFAAFKSNKAENNFNIESYFNTGVNKISDIDDELYLMLATSQTFFYTCWSKLFLRSVIINNNLSFPIDRKYAEDMVFVYNYLRFCKSISFVNTPVYYYYVNEANATSVIPESFETVRFIYNWKKKYFSSISCNTELVERKLVSTYLYNTFLSIKTAATYMNYFRACSYIKSILDCDEFIKLYSETDEYKVFKCKSDKLLDKYIRRKKSSMITFLYKTINLKSKFLRGKR